MKSLFVLIFLSLSVSAQSLHSKILSVGAITINACQNAKVLADWYSKFGIELSEYQGIFYGQIDTAAGPFVFGIHPKKGNSPAQCSGNISVTYRVENFQKKLLALKANGIMPVKTEVDPDIGQFAYFQDPDNNEVKIWGE